MRSTSKPPESKSKAALIASRTRAEIEALLSDLSPNAQAALPFLFDVWGMPGHQLPPGEDWRTWLILGGRGAGKTRAGAEWVRAQMEGATPLSRGRRRRAALVGATLDEAREIMVRGESGILACSPPDRRPVWSETRRVLTWPNGAEAACYSASRPESLRGPQFDCAWADELGKWPHARQAWDMLQLALRLGDDPQQVVTTTPRANPVLEALIAEKRTGRTIVVSAPTWANQANLAPSYLEAVTASYAGTAQGREELEGEMLLDRPGALWSRETIEAGRVREAPPLRRIVVAVDPPATSGAEADECGIVVAGLSEEGDEAYVLADLSSRGETPNQWAGRAVAAFESYNADRLIAEVNQGGDMVETILRQIAPQISYRPVRARTGKGARAEPVSSLYERGKVRHVGGFPALEDQMRSFGAPGAAGSPDRVDALVWAITDLMIAPVRSAPRARSI